MENLYLSPIQKSLVIPRTILQRYHPGTFISLAMGHPRRLLFKPCIEI